MTSKKSVSINANNVQIKQAKNLQNTNAKKAKASNKRSRMPRSVTNGTQTGLSNILTASSGVRGASTSNFGDLKPLSDQSSEFFKLYTDPNGEHTVSLDAARVPDGALQTSSPGFFRVVQTIAFPWQQPGNTDLSGKTYSMLFLQYPFFRSLTIVLARENDGEFSDAIMAAFTKTFAEIVPELSYYPLWVNFDSGAYFTIVDTQALRNIVPPEDGQSGIIDAYRFSSQGLSVYFNTPDLVDQGTFVSHRYPVDISTHTFVERNDSPGGVQEFFQTSAVTVSLLQRNITITSESFQTANLTVSPGGSSTSATFTAAKALRIPGVVNFIISVGNTYNYSITNAPNAQIVRINNVTTSTNYDLLTMPPTFTLNATYFNVVRYYRTSGEDLEEDIKDEEVNLISLPPVTQADILQQNPKAVVELAKDTEGVYLPSCLMQPIFAITSASEYRKILLTSKSSQVTNMFLDPDSGYYDTVYGSFSVNVINFQGIPYACKPMIKICRSAELVPSPNSILGITTTGCPNEQAEVIDMAKAFHECQPHGYPVDYNGLGVLFGKALEVVNAIPNLLRSGRNISQAVKEVCGQEIIDDAKQHADELLTSGLKRLMRIK